MPMTDRRSPAPPVANDAASLASWPVRLDATPRAWPWWDVAGLRALEAWAASQGPPHALMRHAGRAAARLAAALRPHARRVVVLAGPGNNGGDGVEAALQLHRLGRKVELVVQADPARWPTDAAASWRTARAAGVPWRASLPSGALGADDLVMDALLGLGPIGRARPLEGALGAAALWANQAAAAGVAVLAIDLPSGLDAETGLAVPGAVRATHTLSLLGLKPGLFTGAGRDHVGELWFCDLGVATDGLARASDPTGWLLAPTRPTRNRVHDSHKGSYGSVAVVGGAAGMRGAAQLAARAALGVGAGRVWLALLDDSHAGGDALEPAVMRAPPGELLNSTRPDLTVVIGCGGGTSVAAWLPASLAHARSLVVDADALRAIAADTHLATLLRSRSTRGQATVLTPHPGEAADLLGSSGTEVQANRLAAARELVERYGATVILKGSGSIVAAPQWLGIVATGHPVLASAGTGDVLAGLVGGLLAQGMEARAAAAAAATEHGARAQEWVRQSQSELGRRSFTANELLR